MPNYTLTTLGISSAGAGVLYIALVCTTIFFASWQTELSASARDAESRIAALETEYYEAIGRLSSADLGSVGFADPRRVEYVSADRDPAVTRLDR